MTAICRFLLTNINSCNSSHFFINLKRYSPCPLLQFSFMVINNQFKCKGHIRHSNRPVDLQRLQQGICSWVIHIPNSQPEEKLTSYLCQTPYHYISQLRLYAFWDIWRMTPLFLTSCGKDWVTCSKRRQIEKNKLIIF